MTVPDTDPTRTSAAPADQVASAASDRDETAPSAPHAGRTAPNFGPPAAPGEVGTLGPYRLVKQLGAGGMGAVYLAVDARLDRKLALKVMLPEFAADGAAKDRFVREARAAAKVSHDNVVTVYEADERDGVPYIAMQLLQGYPLDEFLKKKGTPPLPHVVRIAREAAAGLAAAHALGLVHRDIKPANLWLEAPAGRVKVLDFGLAKPVGSDAELTRSGAVVGTPAYMSPEQARGQKVDHRTDLFSLGAVLYRLCAGKNPFSGPSVMAVLMALGTEEPAPVRELNPNVPESLAQLIHQLLAKKPEDRPQTAAEVAKRLRVILDQILAPPMATAAEQSTSQPVMVPSVVATPLHVTARPEDVFADIDADERSDARTEAEAEPVAKEKRERGPVGRRKPERAKGGKGVWVAAGLAVLMAVVAAGVVVIKIRNKDGTTTEIKVPEGSTVTVEKDGKPLAQVGPGPGQPGAKSDDRAAAEWALSIGGNVKVRDAAGAVREFAAANDLPAEEFTLAFLILTNCGDKVTDADLVRLKGLTELGGIDLGQTKVTDAGLEQIKSLPRLGSVTVHDTAVTDAGLAKLKGMARLINLNLNNTRVTDAGLEAIQKLAQLKYLKLTGTGITDAGLERLCAAGSLRGLELRKTKVTKAGVEKLAKALPQCEIIWDGGTIQPTAKASDDRAAAEWALSVGGKVSIKEGAGEREVTEAKGLPAEPFTVSRIDLMNCGAKVTDGDLTRLKGLAGLDFLGLYQTEVTDAGLVNLSGMSGLTRLGLNGTRITGTGLVHLKELPRLQRLDLSSSGVTDAGLKHLSELRGLVALNLIATGTSDAGLVHLKGLTELQSLGLAHTKVTDAGLLHLKPLKRLNDLDFHETAITDAGLERLAEMAALLSVKVSKSKVTKAGVEKLAKALPKCKIEWDGGTIESAKK